MSCRALPIPGSRDIDVQEAQVCSKQHSNSLNEYYSKVVKYIGI